MTHTETLKALMDRATPGEWKATDKYVRAPETEDRLALDVQVNSGNQDDRRANTKAIAAAVNFTRRMLEPVTEAEVIASCGSYDGLTEYGSDPAQYVAMHAALTAFIESRIAEGTSA